ncbi:Hypothetical predicted protein [Paramuricea clavata]|uniref:Uncharacterized protein n=1 Tax=Paramuricea clavata TaxID=317549 RepID=A0A7D9IP54_PARCT|nr:Hypothetical predicted protein [Paramuricea clavata]
MANLPHRELIPDGTFLANGNNYWSKWFTEMKPGNHGDTAWTKRREQHVGLRRISVKHVADNCGIFEWKIKCEAQEKIIFIGSTSSLRNRIREYSYDGSHKGDLINEALGRGYTMCVRFKTFLYIGESQQAVNELLGKYNYAWNVTNNGELRAIDLL